MENDFFKFLFRHRHQCRCCWKMEFILYHIFNNSKRFLWRALKAPHTHSYYSYIHIRPFYNFASTVSIPRTVALGFGLNKFVCHVGSGWCALIVLVSSACDIFLMSHNIIDTHTHAHCTGTLYSVHCTLYTYTTTRTRTFIWSESALNLNKPKDMKTYGFKPQLDMIRK